MEAQQKHVTETVLRQDLSLRPNSLAWQVRPFRRTTAHLAFSIDSTALLAVLLAAPKVAVMMLYPVRQNQSEVRALQPLVQEEAL